MSKSTKSFSKFFLLLLSLVFLISHASIVNANPQNTAQHFNDQTIIIDEGNYPNTGSAGKAWADPEGPHSTYDWPHEFARMGHTLPSYQRYGSLDGAYFHHGIDMVTPTHGVPVYTRTGGQVNVENYYNVGGITAISTGRLPS